MLTQESQFKQELLDDQKSKYKREVKKLEKDLKQKDQIIE